MRFINLGLITLISLGVISCGPESSFGNFEELSKIKECPQTPNPQSDPSKGCEVPNPE